MAESARLRPVNSKCEEAALSVEDGQDRESLFQRSPTGPRVAPSRAPASQPPARPHPARGNKRRIWSVAFFILVMASFSIRAYRDLSRPEAWDYWKDQYVSPSLTSLLLPTADLDGSGRGRRALLVRGTIGPAAASWFRERLDEAHLVADDAILLSSPGGDLNQAAIMGEIIRSRSLVTAVGVADASGHVRPSYCASACVLIYAGGKTRFGVAGSTLGVHRFVATVRTGDPVAETQRIAGALLSYMTRMGVASSIVTAMSETRDIRWLDPREAVAMNLITDPLSRP
jgi:hypothetical protein